MRREQAEQACASHGDLGLDLEVSTVAAALPAAKFCGQAEMAGEGPSSAEVEVLREKIRDLESMNRVAQMANSQLEAKLKAAADKSVSPRSGQKQVAVLLPLRELLLECRVDLRFVVHA